jgi:hypothetical protein
LEQSASCTVSLATTQCDVLPRDAALFCVSEAKQQQNGSSTAGSSDALEQLVAASGKLALLDRMMQKLVAGGHRWGATRRTDQAVQKACILARATCQVHHHAAFLEGTCAVAACLEAASNTCSLQ